MDTHSGPEVARGVIVALLAEKHHDRIVLGDCIVYLRDGIDCPWPVRTPLEVQYEEQNGRREVERITATRIAK